MKNKIIIRIFLFILIGWCLQFIGGKILKGDLNSFARITIHEMQTTEKIDILFLGDSHLYRGLNPEIFDKKLNKNTFVASTGSQTIDGSYALLREAFYFHPELKSVYLDFDYLHNNKIDFKDRNHLPHIYAISDNLKNKKIKFDFLIHATSPKYWLNSYLILGKNKISPRPNDVIRTVISYFTRDYWRYIPPVFSDEQYYGKGYIPCSNSNPPNHIFYIDEQQDFIFDEVSRDWIKTFNLIVKFCEENNIELNLFSMPETDFCVMTHTHYEDYDNYINHLLEKTNFNFYDFNLVKKEFLNLPTDYFLDPDHLNYTGSETFSTFFADFILNNKSFDYFYKSISEKQTIFADDILGFIDESDSEKIQIQTIAGNNAAASLFYDYIFVDSNNVQEPLKLHTSDNFCNYPKNSKGSILVKAYVENECYTSITRNFNTLWLK